MPAMDDKVRGGLVLYEHEAAEICERIRGLVTGPIQKQLGLDPIREVAIIGHQAPGTAGTWEINRRLTAARTRTGRTRDGRLHGRRARTEVSRARTDGCGEV